MSSGSASSAPSRPARSAPTGCWYACTTPNAPLLSTAVRQVSRLRSTQRVNEEAAEYDLLGDAGRGGEGGEQPAPEPVTGISSRTSGASRKPASRNANDDDDAGQGQHDRPASSSRQRRGAKPRSDAGHAAAHAAAACRATRPDAAGQRVDGVVEAAVDGADRQAEVSSAMTGARRGSSAARRASA
jgi:hypothetical protein